MKILSTHDRTEVLNHNMSLSTTFRNCPCLLNVLESPRAQFSGKLDKGKTISIDSI